MKLVLTAVEVELAKDAFGSKEFFRTVETKCGRKAVLEDGSMVVELNTEVISDFIVIFIRIQPTIVAMVAMVKALDNQLADLGKGFATKWLK